MSIVSRILLILLLILINAFFSGSEAALVAANEIKVKHDANYGNKKAALTIKYINDSTNFLSTIQVGITFIGFVNGFLAAEAFTAPILRLFGPQYVESSLWQGIVKIVITLILTYMQVVFGELVPKKIAIQNPEKFIYRSVKPLSILNKVMNPLVKLLTVSANGVARLFGIKNQKEEMTEDEVRMLVIGSGDALKESEKEMFGKVLDFDDHLVNEVMTHRTEVVAINLAMDSKEIMQIIREEQYS
ncbi:MAG TPA: CNNM domain-containing protein, partial [Haploplasma sp.]|nr:CNNM domain-containing protein [Haploplasma sp.]